MVANSFVVAWMLAERENSALAIKLLRDAVTRYEIPAAQLSVHQDRGAPMRAGGFQQVLQDLGVSQSYSRPRASNDNPYSEAHFRTLKYQSDYPHRFRGVQEARTWCADPFTWYNEADHHVGLGLHTPADVYFDRAKTIAAARQLTLNAAYQRNPARFVNGPPKAALPPERVAINPIDPGELVTAERILTARESELVALAPTPTLSTAPTVNLPGRKGAGRGSRSRHHYLELTCQPSQAR
ncbi:MAG: transposase [Polyangiaceae bacterium]|nr:transposase [Polyangiaceae bacterium]